MPRRIAVAVCATISAVVLVGGAQAIQPVKSEVPLDLLPVGQKYAGLSPFAVYSPHSPPAARAVPTIELPPSALAALQSTAVAAGPFAPLPALSATSGPAATPAITVQAAGPPAPDPSAAPTAAPDPAQPATLGPAAALSPPPPPPPPALSLDAPSAEALYRLRACESTDNYGSVSAGGSYRGAYQFAQGTWDAVASRWYPDLVGADPAAVSPEGQDALARALYAERGRSPWPHCGRYL